MKTPLFTTRFIERYALFAMRLALEHARPRGASAGIFRSGRYHSCFSGLSAGVPRKGQDLLFHAAVAVDRDPFEAEAVGRPEYLPDLSDGGA